MSRYATRTQVETYVAPMCPVCKIDRCSVDCEPGCEPSHYSTCDHCFGLVANAPMCPCTVAGPRFAAHKTTVQLEAGTRNVLGYVCEHTGRKATVKGWAIANGRRSAQQDIELASDGTRSYGWILSTRAQVQLSYITNLEAKEAQAAAEGREVYPWERCAQSVIWAAEAYLAHLLDR